MGTDQWIEGLAVHAGQKRETAKGGPPTQASGRRRYSSRSAHDLPRTFCLARKRSYHTKIGTAKTPLTPTRKELVGVLECVTYLLTRKEHQGYFAFSHTVGAWANVSSYAPGR
jgi:hypothetical protein